MNKPSDQTLQLRLYVAPNSRASTLARRNLETALDILQPHEADVEVVDVTEHPRRAARDGALVTPLLVRVQPEPRRKVGGTLEDQKSLLAVLSGLS
ncbi:circadian clock KaiB family protein [Persicimonas caeni]|nr:circadian clock KaiB family protein [Persicimonas caeni]